MIGHMSTRSRTSRLAMRTSPRMTASARTALAWLRSGRVSSVLAGLLYPLTRGYGSVVALALAVFLLLGRHMIERQVAGVVSDLQEARRQYGRTRNPEYLQFIDLLASGLLRDNKMLTAPAKAWLAEQIEWAREKTAKHEQRAAKKARKRRRNGAPERAPETEPPENESPEKESSQTESPQKKSSQTESPQEET